MTDIRLEACTCPDNDWRACINGQIYGPCDSANCGGVCEPVGKCRCELHPDLDHDAYQVLGGKR